MFDKEFKKTETINHEEDKPSVMQESEEVIDDFDEVEELEEVEEFEDQDELDDTEVEKSPAVDTEIRKVEFFTIDDIKERITSNVTDTLTAPVAVVTERGDSMETLVKTRTIGILPELDDLGDGFDFGNETAELIWTDEGLDYDRFLQGFKKGATGIYKSLMSLSKDYNAICGVLLAGSRKGLETDYSVGLDDESATNLSITRNESLWSEWFGDRRLIFVPNLSGSLYAEKTSHNDFRYIRSALFLPVLYHGSQSYIFLGFKDPPSDPLTMIVSD